MKNIYTVLILLLCINCTAYKKIDNPDFVNGKQYQIITTNGGKQKMIVLEQKQDSLVVQSNSDISIIAKKDITETREKKFSWLKTLGVIIGVAAVSGGVLLLSFLKMLGW